LNTIGVPSAAQNPIFAIKMILIDKFKEDCFCARVVELFSEILLGLMAFIDKMDVTLSNRISSPFVNH
jgi:hypothetical protein